MNTCIKFLSRVVLVTALILTSCSKEYSEDYTASNENPVRLKASSIKEKAPTSNKEDLESMLNSIAILSKMDYPIKDVVAFEKILKSFGGTTIYNTFEKSYSKSDFPLYSFREAFKIHYHNNPIFVPIRTEFPNLPAIDPELPDDVRGEPQVCDVLKRDGFSPAATDCGCRVYVAAMRGGHNRYQATIQAVFAALNYDPMTGCDV